MEKKEIGYYDSMGSCGRDIADTLVSYLEQEMKDKKGSVFNRSEWSEKDMGSSIPQQSNCSDCGVFVCTNSILLCLKLVGLNSSLNFSH